MAKLFLTDRAGLLNRGTTQYLARNTATVAFDIILRQIPYGYKIARHSSASHYTCIASVRFGVRYRALGSSEESQTNYRVGALVPLIPTTPLVVPNSRLREILTCRTINSQYMCNLRLSVGTCVNIQTSNITTHYSNISRSNKYQYYSVKGPSPPTWRLRRGQKIITRRLSYTIPG